MSKTIVRTVVAFSDNKNAHTIPDDVLYINTDIKKLCFNKNGKVFIVDLEYND